MNLGTAIRDKQQGECRLPRGRTANQRRRLRNVETIDRLGRTAIRSALAAGIALSLSAGFAIAADNATEDQILKALTPKRLTRSLSAARRPIRPRPRKSRSSSTRSKTGPPVRCRAGEREQIAEIAKEKPSIDLEITFDYNSATISQKAMPAVAALGKALTNPDLKGTTFVLAGHTDAKGGDGYNQELSERRADSLKKYLMEKYGIAAADLVTVGYGKTKLKNRGRRRRTKTAACRSSTWRAARSRATEPRPKRCSHRISVHVSVLRRIARRR